MKLLRSTLSFGSMTFLSRLSGYARDLVQAGVFGATAATDAFLIAYRIPNFLRRIFAEGNFSQAFVPVFSEVRERGDPRELRLLLDHVAGALAALVLLVSALGVIFAPGIAALFAPGALDEPEKFALTSEMLRITFPYLFFISLTALAAGVLNSYGRFAVPAVTPVLHNLCVIAAALWLAPRLQVPIKALAWGVFAAGVVQLAVQWVALARIGFVPRFRFNLRFEGVRRVFRLMGPMIFGSSVAQINLLVGTMAASLLATGSQTWLYLTDRLLEFPQGIVGAALGTVILPALARRHAANDAAGYSATLDWGLRMALLASVPAMLGLVLMAEPLNATLYQYGRFTEFDTRMAALSLMGLSIGLPGFMLAKVLAPAFYARQDTRAPVRAAVLTVIANLALMAAITGFLAWRGVEGAHAGIALATALAGTLNAVLLWRALGREGTHRPSPGWPRFLSRTALASLAMVGFLLWARHEVGAWSALAPAWRVIHLAWIVAGSAAIYAVALLAMGMRPRHLREE